MCNEEAGRACRHAQQALLNRRVDTARHRGCTHGTEGRAGTTGAHGNVSEKLEVPRHLQRGKLTSQTCIRPCRWHEQDEWECCGEE